MEIELEKYLENVELNKSIVKSRLVHPITKVELIPREILNNLIKYTDNYFQEGLEPRFISLAGLRGVGKTTLLFQIANYILEKYNYKLYLFNVNILQNLNITLYSALEGFQTKILKKKFSELSQPIIILFDEIQDDENWSKTLKILFDESKAILCFSTGSSALLLNSTADLSRRVYIEKVFPFSFIELLNSLNQKDTNYKINDELKTKLKEVLFYSKDIKECEYKLNNLKIVIESILSEIIDIDDLKYKYINYLNLPNLLYFNDEIVINNILFDLVKRIIYEDIGKLKTNNIDFRKIENLLMRLAGSDEINVEKLAGIIGLKQSEINEIIEMLSKAELINLILPFGGLNSRISKNKKAFFMSPSLRKSLLSNIYGINLPDNFKSKLIEDLVVMYLKKVLKEGLVSYSTGKNDVNPDFIIETLDKPILLEIGSNKLTTKQIKACNIENRYSILVTNGVECPNIKGSSLILPLNWFLLL